MAFSAVWIAVASLLATFDIEKAMDENGNVIEPTHEYISAIVPCATFFLRCAYFTSPRSPKSGYQNLINAQSNLVQGKQKPLSALLNIRKFFNFVYDLIVSSSSFTSNKIHFASFPCSALLFHDLMNGSFLIYSSSPLQIHREMYMTEMPSDNQGKCHGVTKKKTLAQPHNDKKPPC